MSARPIVFRLPWGVLLVVGLLSPGLATGQEADKPELFLQAGHSGGISRIAFSPDGRLLASSGVDCTVRLWDARTRCLLRTLPVHGPALFVAFSADNRTIGWAGLDEMVLCDVASGRVLARLAMPASYIAFSPSDPAVACACRDGVVRLCSTATGKLLRELRAGGGRLPGLAYRPDGQVLACGGDDRKLSFWDPRAGTLLWTSQDLGSAVTSLAFSPDGKRVVVSHPEGSLEVYDAETREMKWQSGIWNSSTGSDRPDPLNCAAVSPNGKLIAVAQGYHVVFWGLDESGNNLLGGVLDPDGWISSVAFTPDSRHVAYSVQNEIKVIDVPSSSPTFGLGGASLECLTFSPDGRCLAAGDSAGRASVWDTQTGQLRWSSPITNWDVFSLAYSPDGKALAYAGHSTHRVEFCDAETGRSVAGYPGHEPRMRSLAWSADGRRLASASQDLTIRLWDCGRREISHTFKLGKLENPGATAHPVPLAFSHDGRRLASQGETVTSIAIRDTDTGELVPGLKAMAHDGEVLTLAFGADGARLASVGRDGKAKMWDAGTGGLLWATDTPVEDRGAWFWIGAGIAFSPDGGQVACFGPDWRLSVFDTNTGNLLHTLEGDGGPANCLAYSPNGKVLAAGSQDGSIQLWDPEHHRLLAKLYSVHGEGAASGAWLAVSPEGYYDGTTDAARLITWRIRDELYPVDAFRDTFNRPGLVSRLLRGESLGASRQLGNDDVPPAARIVRPDQNSDVAGGVAALEVAAYGVRDLKSLEVYANGRRAPLGTERGIAMEARAIAMEARGISMEARELPRHYTKAKAFRGKVPLPPGEAQVVLRVIAVDEAGLRSAPVEVTVFQRGVQAARGTLHVLAIGVSQYARPEYNLGFAAPDARAIVEALRGQAGPGKLYDRVETAVLTDREATSSAIRSRLRLLTAAAQPADVVVLYVSGHGLRDARFEYYFAGHDVDLGDLAGTAVAWKEFQALVRALKAKQVLVLLDTCHAAGVLGDFAATNQALGEVLADRAGVMVLASSSSAEQSFESAEWGHGAYTKALLEALAGRAGKRLSPGLLEDFVGSRVAELTEGRQHPYVPLRTQFPAGTPILQGG